MMGLVYVWPAGILPFHWAQNGIRTPPSHVVALKPRSGPLLEVVCGVGPPLSLKKKTSVFSSWPISRIFAITRPTASSIAEIMAANVRRFSYAMVVNRARYFYVDCRRARWALYG